MGMASEQNIPVKKDAPSQWSMRRLFPFGGVTTAFSKSFINVFDVLLGFCVFTIGIAEILNRDVSWVFYTLTVLLFFGAFIERRANAIKAAEPKKEK